MHKKTKFVQILNLLH